LNALAAAFTSAISSSIRGERSSPLRSAAVPGCSPSSVLSRTGVEALSFVLRYRVSGPQDNRDRRQRQPATNSTYDRGPIRRRSPHETAQPDLTTHVGSPAPADLLPDPCEERGRSYDPSAFAARVRGAVTDIVRGAELAWTSSTTAMGKPGFIHYANDPRRVRATREAVGSPEGLAGEVVSRVLRVVRRTYRAPRSRRAGGTGPITYRATSTFRRSRAWQLGGGHEDVFMPSISPTSVEDWQRNRYYKTQEEFVFAIAEAMRAEYKAIVDAGFILQIDDPHILTHYVVHANKSLAEVRKWAEVRIEALNHALRDLPRDRYVNNATASTSAASPRPRAAEIVDLVLRIRASAYSFEAANPRHEHEWRVWEGVKLPADTIHPRRDPSNVMIEHPEVVADRIERFAKIVGRENVIAGADCGFGTFAGSDEIHESVVWAKFEALVAGARIATKRLWGRVS
jgi:5-methyltetrahydropteroyltriglutamate--homocysteine methyltransferase